MYDAAMDTLKSIGSHDIEEMRSYRDPPIGVKFVANMLCEMFDKPARYVSIIDGKIPWKFLYKPMKLFAKSLRHTYRPNGRNNVITLWLQIRKTLGCTVFHRCQFKRIRC